MHILQYCGTLAKSCRSLAPSRFQAQSIATSKINIYTSLRYLWQTKVWLLSNLRSHDKSLTNRMKGLPMTWQAYARTSNATIRTCKAFKVFSLYASLFWWVTNQRDSRLLLLMVSFGLAKGLVVHSVFGSFSDMVGFILVD